MLLLGVVVFVFTKFQLYLSTFRSSDLTVSYYYTVRSDDVKHLSTSTFDNAFASSQYKKYKNGAESFVKTKTSTPGNNRYTLLMTFIAFTSFISFKFQTLNFLFKLSYYAWATFDHTRLWAPFQSRGPEKKAENDVKFIQITWIPVKILANFYHPGVGALP